MHKSWPVLPPSREPHHPKSPQADRAGAIKEREGDVPAAIALYLKGGAPARAAQAVAAHPNIAYDPALLSAVSAALARAGLHERAGDLAAALGRAADALAAYRRGRAYRKAVELARTAAPAQAGRRLETDWGGGPCWLAVWGMTRAVQQRRLTQKPSAQTTLVAIFRLSPSRRSGATGCPRSTSPTPRWRTT